MFSFEEEFRRAHEIHLSENAAYRRFVDDLVQYAVDYREFEDPPNVLFGGSYLRSEFGKSFLQFLKSRERVVLQLDEIIVGVVAEFQTDQESESSDFFSKFLKINRYLMESRTPSGCFAFLCVVCKLCLLLTDVGMTNSVEVMKLYAKRMMSDYPNFYYDILWLNTHGCF